jgi:hypothetical protein
MRESGPSPASVICFTFAMRKTVYESPTGPAPGTLIWRSQMAAIARALARALPANQSEIETLKTIVMLCGVGLVVSLLLATYGLDLSPGFF